MSNRSSKPRTGRLPMSRTKNLSRLVALAASGALGVGLFGIPAAHADTSTASPSASPSQDALVMTPEQQAILDARTQAKSTGQSVVVEPLTTESSRTVANPNGTLTTTDNSIAVRTKQSGKWADLDPTLHRNADRSISPAVTQDSLSLSGGGDGPLATLTTADGEKLAVTAPFTLPAPSLDGATATYANVLPDVDLVVSALSNGGWRDVIVVKTAAAAANPRLKTLHFPMSVTGLSIETDAAGNISFKDSAGKARLQAPTPLQWDSTVAPVAGSGSAAPQSLTAVQQADPGALSSAAGPGHTAVVAPMTVKSTGSGLDVTPDGATFGKGTGPWYLDPTVGAVSYKTASTQVQEYLRDAKYFSTADQDLGVGYCGYSGSNPCPAYGRERAYIRVGIAPEIYTQPSGAPAPPTVYDSTMFVNVVDASSPSTSTTFGLYWTGGIDANTTWDNQPCNGGGTFGGCTKIADSSSPLTGTGQISFNVTAQMQQAAAQKWGDWTVGIAPSDENNKLYRHHIRSNVSIATNYDITPSSWWPRSSPTPGFANSDGAGKPAGGDCFGTNNPGWIGATQNLTLSLSQWSPTGQNLTDSFAAWDETANTFSGVWYTPAPAWGSGSVNVPGSTLTDGHQYRWWANANDGLLTSPNSGPCWFRVDKTPPTVNVGSTDFPPSGSPNPSKVVGTAGTFTITGTDPAPSGAGSSGLACFRVSTDSTPVTGWHCNDTGILLPGADGTAAYSYTPPRWGTNVLYVQAQDNAGNYSQPYAYSFYAPWSAAQGVVYGDITGDRRPDILLPDSTGNLRVVQNTVDPAHAGWLVGSAVTSPTGNWQGVQITHHNSLYGGVYLDDLIAHPAGDPRLYLYQNSPSGFTTRTSFFLNGTTTQGAVTCTDAGGVTITCPVELGTNWTNATQILAVGSVDNETIDIPARTYLIAVIGKKLWLFSPGSNNARLLAPKDTEVSSLDWSNYDLIGPGPANGTTTCTNAAGTTTITSQATLWTRERSTGKILSYPITRNPANNCAIDYSALADPTKGTVIGSGINPAAYPTVGSVGDLTGDGIADLYAQNSTGQLTVWPGKVGDPAGHPGVVTGFDGINTVGDLRPPLARYPLAGNANDATGHNNGTAKGDVSWISTGKAEPANAALLNSTANNGEIDTPLQVDTQKSFTVSLWARADQLNEGVALSQDGTGTSNFMIFPSLTNGVTNWTFCMATADSSSGWPYDCTSVYNSAARAQPGAWTKLTATYNATTKQTVVFVNGAPAAFGTHSTTIPATGKLVIGRYRGTGTDSNFFKGAVADVSVSPFVDTLPTVLRGGSILRPGDVVYAAHTMLVMQPDGNLVLYALSIQNTPTGQALWATGTGGNPGAWATLQTDGNLVVYKPDPTFTTPGTSANTLWSSGTAGTPGPVAKVQDDCNFVMYNSSGTVVWHTKTYNPNP
ncbi:LamG-like jellyroll fold domain-containing protein [Kitasatospora griseola]|uniref:LamG-like jellyroll fold domain-containing protein n=1 Tax=Kitasatospora griseola TaxID=2064 RepID=UPI0036549A47